MTMTEKTDSAVSLPLSPFKKGNAWYMLVAMYSFFGPLTQRSEPVSDPSRQFEKEDTLIKRWPVILKSKKRFETTHFLPLWDPGCVTNDRSI